jgi:hypothetical protein
MKPRIWVVALGVLTGLLTLSLFFGQGPLLRLAIENGVNFLFLPLSILALITFMLCMAAQSVFLALHGSFGDRRDAI